MALRNKNVAQLLKQVNDKIIISRFDTAHLFQVHYLNEHKDYVVAMIKMNSCQAYRLKKQVLKAKKDGRIKEVRLKAELIWLNKHHSDGFREHHEVWNESEFVIELEYDKVLAMDSQAMRNWHKFIWNENH